MDLSQDILRYIDEHQQEALALLIDLAQIPAPSGQEHLRAEFCLKCFNAMNGTNYKANEVWLEEDFCEGCADWRPCVMELHPKPIFWRLVDAIRRLFQK